MNYAPESRKSNTPRLRGAFQNPETLLFGNSASAVPQQLQGVEQPVLAPALAVHGGVLRLVHRAFDDEVVAEDALEIMYR